MNIPLPVVLFTAYSLGYWFSFIMLRAEQEADGETYTRGDRAVIAATSLISWLMVIIMLVRAWVNRVGIKGYWAKPVTPLEEPTKVEVINEPRKTDTQYPLSSKG
jgi:hypothetical protein